MKKNSETPPVAGIAKRKPSRPNVDRTRSRNATPTVQERSSVPAAGPQCLEGGDALAALFVERKDEFSHAKAQWLLGDWVSLSRIALNELENHPDRDRLALLVASAHHQIGQHAEAANFVRQARVWGCPPHFLSQVLVGGLHNTLGRAAALGQDEIKAIQHFRDSIGVVSNGRNADLLVHARTVRQLGSLGLLPEAATLINRELEKTHRLAERPEITSARIKVLQTGMELLSHELSLAQQRQQLHHKTAAEGSLADSDDVDWKASLKQRSVSQLGQDLWILEQTNYRRGGYFVEFGATDGVLLSNTLLLESGFGWDGLCAEPNPRFFEQLKVNRKCRVSDACIGANSGEEVEFILADAFGGFSRHADTDLHSDRRAAYAQSGGTITLRTVSLNDFLVQNNSPAEIDYLSIDTEGSEYEILASFPFENWSIKYITVEHNYTPQRIMIRNLLESHGYKCVEREWDDWYMLGGISNM